MNLKIINEEVFFTEEKITSIGMHDVTFLKDKAKSNRRKRARFCFHENIQDPVHEMMIVHTKGSYIRPHKHLYKSESFHMVEGVIDVVIFDDSGEIAHVVNMGDCFSGKTFYYRLSRGYFHTLIPLSDFVVFHETTNGPFKREQTLFAPWAPREEDQGAAKKYLDGVITAYG